MSERDERRRKKKDDERRQEEALDKLLEEPRLPLFEAPPAGKIVEDPTRPKR